ncbi:reverse transcriptase family protein [Bremerella volcania]|nr:reverse transcriptase family protein [Bremerella volcania]
MVAPAVTTTWQAPLNLRTPQDLSHWLDLKPGELAWFSDRRQLEAKQNKPKLQHYRYRLLPKRPGEFRLIEAPKPRLKTIQRRILKDILNHLPPHDASHGFRCGRSISSFARPHIGREVVLKMDLQDFFPSIRAAQVQAIFRSLGYPDCVADLLTGLCTNSAPTEIWNALDHAPPAKIQYKIRRYARPHLPQGAPTSPVLANLCAFRMDSRLAGLARKMNASFTRYADDLAFSGDCEFARICRRFSVHVAAIAMEEGYTVHYRKTKIMRKGVRQRIAGIVVNKRPNILRKDYDRLKAILSNCVRTGPASQNREGHDDFQSHLAGRVSFVEMIHPDRGRKLRAILEQIDWTVS